MKRALTLGIGVLALVGSTFAASAADLGARPIGKAPVIAPPVVYDWSGFYIGGHIGGLWGEKDWVDVTVPALPVALLSHEVSGFLAGAQAGFNFQSGAFVFGIEGQWSWTNADGEHTCVQPIVVVAVIPGINCRTEMDWVATVAGRIGYAFNNVLFYAKGGLALASEEFTVLTTGAGIVPVVVGTAGDDTRTGWMVGAGIEYGFTPNWSAKIEYNFMDFGSEQFNFLDPVTGLSVALIDIDQHVHVVKAGINYRFNWGIR
jgi:outer membrane immunogenic protein